jgi:hypothetical protein
MGRKMDDFLTAKPPKSLKQKKRRISPQPFLIHRPNGRGGEESPGTQEVTPTAGCYTYAKVTGCSEASGGQRSFPRGVPFLPGTQAASSHCPAPSGVTQPRSLTQAPRCPPGPLVKGTQAPCAAANRCEAAPAPPPIRARLVGHCSPRVLPTPRTHGADSASPTLPPARPRMRVQVPQRATIPFRGGLR